MATPTSGNTMRRWVVQGSYWASARIARKTATPAGRKPTSGIARAPSSITATRPIRRGHEPSSALRGRPPPKGQFPKENQHGKATIQKKVVRRKTEGLGIQLSRLFHPEPPPGQVKPRGDDTKKRSREVKKGDSSG